MKNRLLLLAAMTLAGCQVETQDLEQHIATVKQNTQISIEPYPEFTTQPPFTYGAATKRSPFQRPKGSAAKALVKNERVNCLQPDFDRAKQPLERYGLDALSVTGMFTSQGKQWALFQANDGSLYKATAGDFVGLFFGKITSISNGTVAITEMLPDGAGCWQTKEATLTMASQAGESDNV
ncbi:pilus assembly protein PilP [Fluctibacter halophilus]|nr:pilus assembly protein PilP [Aestuariibacter halophilus]